MNAITTYRPGLLGHKVINEVFDNFFNDFPTHLKASTQGYPVADIYRDDDGSTVLEFALAGFKRKELAIDIQPDKRSITITGKAGEANSKRQRIARRNFTRTYVNYDNNACKKQCLDNSNLVMSPPPLRRNKGRSSLKENIKVPLNDYFKGFWAIICYFS